MDVVRVRTFLEIVRGGSFLAAAERLHVTQTTISARIRTLEDELGQQLFIRNRSGARMTHAGEDFRPHAESFVQVWERATHQLAVPEGRTSVIAIGGELTLWDPLLLDWLVQMRSTEPDIAVRTHVAQPDRLMHQVRIGVLDLAVMYTPRLEPGLVVDQLLEEKLVLVRSLHKCSDEYVYVGWGPQFAAMHEASFPVVRQPGLFVGLGPLGLNYILRAGGCGYFRSRVVAPFVQSGELEIVEDAPQFSYPAYVVSSQTAAESGSTEQALKVLHDIASRY